MAGLHVNPIRTAPLNYDYSTPERHGLAKVLGPVTDALARHGYKGGSAGNCPTEDGGVILFAGLQNKHGRLNLHA